MTAAIQFCANHSDFRGAQNCLEMTQKQFTCQFINRIGSLQSDAPTSFLQPATVQRPTMPVLVQLNALDSAPCQFKQTAQPFKSGRWGLVLMLAVKVTLLQSFTALNRLQLPILGLALAFYKHAKSPFHSISHKGGTSSMNLIRLRESGHIAR